MILILKNTFLRGVFSSLECARARKLSGDTPRGDLSFTWGVKLHLFF